MKDLSETLKLTKKSTSNRKKSSSPAIKQDTYGARHKTRLASRGSPGGLGGPTDSFESEKKRMVASMGENIIKGVQKEMGRRNPSPVRKSVGLSMKGRSTARHGTGGGAYKKLKKKKAGMSAGLKSGYKQEHGEPPVTNDERMSEMEEYKDVLSELKYLLHAEVAPALLNSQRDGGAYTSHGMLSRLGAKKLKSRVEGILAADGSTMKRPTSAPGGGKRRVKMSAY